MIRLDRERTLFMFSMAAEAVVVVVVTVVAVVREGVVDTWVEWAEAADEWAGRVALAVRGVRPR